MRIEIQVVKIQMKSLFAIITLQTAFCQDPTKIFKVLPDDNGLLQFQIGSENQIISLIPRMNIDATLIASKNCTACGPKPYDFASSKTAKIMDENMTSISIIDTDTNRVFMTGYQASDLICTNKGLDCPSLIEQGMPFYLVNQTVYFNILQNSNGILGLTPSKKSQSFGQYLVQRNLTGGNTLGIKINQFQNELAFGEYKVDAMSVGYKRWEVKTPADQGEYVDSIWAAEVKEVGIEGIKFNTSFVLSVENIDKLKGSSKVQQYNINNGRSISQQFYEEPTSFSIQKDHELE